MQPCESWWPRPPPIPARKRARALSDQTDPSGRIKRALIQIVRAFFDPITVSHLSENALVAEDPDAGEGHGQTRLIGSGNDLGVADRAAGLDDRRRTGLCGLDEAVGKGEEGV